MKDLITIGLPSKGRLKEKSISLFNDRGLKIIQSEKRTKPSIKLPLSKPNPILSMADEPKKKQ